MEELVCLYCGWGGTEEEAEVYEGEGFLLCPDCGTRLVTEEEEFEPIEVLEDLECDCEECPF